jgi:uncharacterized cofD-like protein
LQKEYAGSSYTGDLSKCIVALCNDEVLAKALSYRYEQGSLNGHSVKNLLFHALEKVENTQKALETMWKLCDLGVHRILPVTYEKTELCASLHIGNTISGEANIDTIAKNPLWNPQVHSIFDIYLKPEVQASDLSIEAITEADYLLVCPGDLYSSIIPVLLPHGIKESILESKAKIILILNIMTKKGETDNYTATDFVERIEKHLGRKTDYILYNNAVIPDSVLLQYSLEQKVELDEFIEISDSRLRPVSMAVISKIGQLVSSPEVIQEAISAIINAE